MEIANAGVFAALAVVIVSVGAFLPRLGAIELLSVVPFAIVGLRNRRRAVVAAAIAAAFVAFLVAGATATVVVAACAVLGGLCGIIRRHGRGSGMVAPVAAGLAPVSAAAVVGVLYLFSAARALTFGTIRASVAGVGRIAEPVAGLRPDRHAAEGITDALLGAWPIVVAVGVLVGVPVGMLLTNAVVTGVARRVEWLAHADPLDHAARTDAALGRGRRAGAARVGPRRFPAPCGIGAGRARGCRPDRRTRGVRRGRRSERGREVYVGVIARRR